ncbi:uncharacterized protein PpBr36_11057 [Pyricularia pennisetigena]|uniref:uncharacterized protein n=1 Tax=Pyricularia pennisetigena TaxID=1578925 RepID=UPI0011508E84|nr:uncharacterized protein PpBr36_11041 [Pyricularia pennisetigena]XP_029743549.1 uncharacterized protein PpBr36_11057 [Pyricularia pennisetigena]TLS20682.1 hypothetical protein PpBr36_11041 [Pyricularia pennisetigena]TLS20699.1 hypothetical protein PpBr36_11057 [Pyricularia pennisetigena]
MDAPAKRTATHINEDPKTLRVPKLYQAGGSLPSVSSKTSQRNCASPSKKRREVETMQRLSLRNRSFSTRKPNNLPEASKITLRDLTQANKGRRISFWSRHVCKIQKGLINMPKRLSYDEAAWTTGVVFHLLNLAIPGDEQLVLVPWSMLPASILPF